MSTKKVTKIGVLTSGGDAPGMNAAIRAVVRTAIYHGIEVYGIVRGYNGMVEGDIFKMDSKSVANIIQRGGTILKTARSAAFFEPEGRKKAYDNLKKFGIDGLVVIGGDGSFKGAQKFSNEFDIPCIGIPGTIDKDIAGSDFTIGFDTAVNTAVEAIDKIRDTADAHNRIFFVEVMGRHSGHIALLSGIAGGAEGIFIPERGNEFDDIVHLYESKARKKEFSIFVVAEGDEEGRAYEISKRFQAIYPETDCRVTVLGHVQRGGRPTANDRILASRLGAHAVKALIDGRKNEAVGVVNNDIKFTSFQEAIEHKKDIQDNLWILNTIITR